jgi:hypothetical protein
MKNWPSARSLQGGVRVLNEEVVCADSIYPEAEIDQSSRSGNLMELERRERAYRGEDRPMLEIRQPYRALWWTTAWRRAQACAPRSTGCARSDPDRIVVAVPTAASPETCAYCSRPSWMKSSARKRRSRSTVSAVGTRISRKRRTKRCACSWSRYRKNWITDKIGHGGRL